MKQTTNDLKSLEKQLKQLRAQLNESIEEIHKEKLNIQRMKTDILNSLQEGYFIRDERRIVLSAPEIIIGNVDKNGVLLGNGRSSQVIIRSNNINVEAADIINSPGSGEIACRASKISQKAVNPGIDGCENEVTLGSKIVSQGKSITIDCPKVLDQQEFFISEPNVSANGIIIHSETEINIDASNQCKTLEKKIQSEKKKYDKRIEELKEKTKDDSINVGNVLDELVEKNEKAQKLETVAVRIDYMKIDKRRQEYNRKAKTLYETMNQYYYDTAELLECGRIKNCLSHYKLPTQADFTNKSVNTSITLCGENLNFSSKDGEGNIRTNKGAGIRFQGMNYEFTCEDKDKKIIDKSQFNVYTQSFTVDTSIPTYRNNKLDKKTADGNINLLTKNFEMRAADMKAKENQAADKPVELEEEKLAAKGKFKFRVEKVVFDSTTTEGKATGVFKANAKNVILRSMDKDKDANATETDNADGTTKIKYKIAKDGEIGFNADNIYVGGCEEENTGTLVQTTADTIASGAYETVSIYVGEESEDTSYLEIQEKTLGLTANEVSVKGKEFIVEGKTFLDEVTSDKLTSNNLSVSTKFNACGKYSAGNPAGKGAPKKKAKKANKKKRQPGKYHNI